MRVFARTILVAAMPWLASSAHAQSVEEFYKSHPITMLVGSGAGGGRPCGRKHAL